MTLACEDRDFPEWHRGIPRAYLWGALAPVDIAPARAALAGLLLPRYERQPHVTVAYCGLEGRDFDDERLRLDLERLAPLARGPVAVRPRGWASFTPSPMLELDGGWLAQAHLALSEGLPDRIPSPYRPHVTVGFYSVEVPLDVPLGRLSDVPVPASWVVPTLQLLSYDTHDIAGPLTVVGELDLTTGCYDSR